MKRDRQTKRESITCQATPMRRFTAKITKLIFAVILITLGICMYIHPVASDYFYIGSKYAGAHTGHFSEWDMQAFGIMIVILGLVIVYSTFRGSRK